MQRKFRREFVLSLLMWKKDNTNSGKGIDLCRNHESLLRAEENEETNEAYRN